MRRLRGSIAPLAIVAIIAGCSSSGSPSATVPTPTQAPSTSASSPGASAAASAASCPAGPVAINFWDFQGATEIALVSDFEKTHPCIKVTQKVTDYDAHHQALTTALASGTGVPDVAGVEIAQWPKYLAQPQNFVNLNDVGAKDVQSEYLPWMWQMASTSGGADQLGIPPAAAGLAIAYRADYFEKAGLPKDRDAVAQLWPTWDAFVATCRTFSQKTKIPFVDSLGITFEGVLGQASKQYYDTNGTPIYATNPSVRAAWDVAAAVHEAGCSAKITPWTDDWTTGMAKGSFGAMVAPSWMQNVISGAAPNDKGKWDIAALPGVGGNQGGSWLTIPAKAQHPTEAWEFIKWVTAPEQQLVVFNTQGALPSTSSIFDSPDIQNATSAYFNNAPIGKIYTKSLSGLQAPPMGPDQLAIDNEFQAGLSRLDQGKETSEQAWNSTLEKIKLQIGQ
ncbi:MAG: extracellular solute-binding protein [Candidatus Dormibacteraeota bacterium]|nr:extracellular solute-binding protein [Candidatus Dormibacteraeota bacterium]